MKRFASILLTLDGSPEAAKAAACALWLAEKLGATLHVLHATPQPLPAAEALARLHIPEARRAQVIVHQTAGNAATAALEAITAYHVRLVVMSARGESAAAGLEPARALGTVARAVIEHSPVPVLLLPPHCGGAVPWGSVLAAVSGEASANQALETAAQLASALGLAITVLHSEDGPAGARIAPLGAYADQPYHEYPHRLEEMVERGVAGCMAEQPHCRINKALLRSGDAGTALLDQVARHGNCVVALGWHGALGAGRAPVLKRLLDAGDCALLIVRGSERPRSRLKVASEIDQD